MTSARWRRQMPNSPAPSISRGGMFSSSGISGSSSGSNHDTSLSNPTSKTSSKSTTSPVPRPMKKGSSSMVAKPSIQILGVPKIIKPPSQQQQQQPSTILINNESSSANILTTSTTNKVVVPTMTSSTSTPITASATVSMQHPSSPSRSSVIASTSPLPPSTPPPPASSSNTSSSSEGLYSPPDRVQSQSPNSATKQLLKRGGGVNGSSPLVPSKSARANISNRFSPLSPSQSSAPLPSASPLPAQGATKFMNSHWEILTDRVSKLLSAKSEANAGLLTNEFYVVGVFGGRATGKSTLGNILAGSMLEQPFEVCGAHEIIHCERKTRGLDLYVTSDRILILDCEALFADSSESEPEMTSLHLGLFLYSICHVLIIPHVDPYPDSHLIRYVRTLENLKKGIPDQFNKASPKIVFVANDQHTDALSRVPSALSSIHGFETFVMKHDPDEQTKHLFRECVFRGVERRFRGGEKDWLNACGKNWELIRKNYFFGEYIRTVQRIYISS